MSHVESCSVTISNLAAVKAACEALGLEFKENQRSYSWYGRHVGDYPITAAMTEAGVTPKNLGTCAHAIHVPGTSYEVGLFEMKNKPGTFLPLYDFFGVGHHLQTTLCKKKPNGQYTTGLEKLADAYSLEVLKAKARAKGYRFTEQTSNGKTKLIVHLGN